LLGIAVTAVLLYLSVRNVDPIEAWEYAKSANAGYIWPSLLLVGAEIFLRALKWQVLLWPLKRASLGKLNSATLIGVMANNVLPARGGEFVRAWAGGRLASVPYSTSLATVVIDRVLDGLTVSALFIFVIIFQPLPDLINRGGYVAGAIYLVTLAFLVGLIVRTEQTLVLAATLMRPLPPRLSGAAVHTLTKFVEGLAVFRSAPLLIAAIAISFAVWITYAVGFWVMFMMFNIPLSLLQGFVILLILTIALTLPAAPGFVGLMEGGIILGLDLFGIDKSQALALAVVYHVMQYIPVTLGGLIALWREGLTMGDITHHVEPEPS
jgi:uncharacterized protein (TIRG00374 family)